MWPFTRKRKARELAADLESAETDGPLREFPWGAVALWAVKLFLWLLSKYPTLMNLALDKFDEFAAKQGKAESYSTKAAISLLRSNVRDYPTTFAKVMEAK